MEWLESLIEGTPRQAHAATFPPDRFYCLLDDLPLHLIPRHAVASSRAWKEDRQGLFLNPECTIVPDGQFPNKLLPQTDLLSGFGLQGTVAWVKDPPTGNMLPFWLGPELEATVRGLRANECTPSKLSREACAVLVDAGILISGNDADRSRQKWKGMVATVGPHFRERGYAPIAGLIHPFHIAALRRYYRYLIRSGRIRLGDGQSPRRYVAYNEPVARFFHYQIAATLSAVAGEPLKPSYVYMASYLSGAELEKHTDRAQCEFSVTLCLDFSPEPELETPWPIQLETPAGKVAVYQALGDGLAYRGTRLPHFRSKLGEGQTSTSIFFHYVPADFAGSLD